ncbi:MAG: hypothetical protein JJU45_11630 [Acidimicrobiia bacterium]|nr:hypothetical protein [Acidimicrobiia bacterium]
MELLFSKGELDQALRSTIEKLIEEVAKWDPDQLLAQSEQEIAAYLAEKHAAHCPQLLRTEMYANEPRDGKQALRDDFYRRVEIDVSRLTVHVPYEGERVIFSLRPNSFTYNPPRADVTDSEVIFTFEDRQLDGEKVRGQLDHELAEIDRWLAWCREMTTRHNDSLMDTALSAVRQRRERLLADRNTVAGLGIPVRRRANAPSIAVPVQRRRPEITRPKLASAPYEPEPALSETDYDEAIRIIVNSGRQLERSPTTTLRLHEEERRDLMLVGLNSQFEGQAGGEVFNGAGKTDILLRVDNRNVFIAECKIWRGPKSFADAIDQLLGYLVWRDTKAALILFIETKDATQTIQKAQDVLEAHSQCIRTLSSGEPTDRKDFVLLSPSDDAREIKLAFLPFVITTPATVDGG